MSENALIPKKFSFAASGSVDDQSFSLIGTGPLGIIIQLDGTLVGSVEDTSSQG